MKTHRAGEGGEEVLGEERDADVTARAMELLAKIPEDEVLWDCEAANEGLETPSADYIDGVNDSLDTYARPMAAVLRELVAEVDRLRPVTSVLRAKTEDVAKMALVVKAAESYVEAGCATEDTDVAFELRAAVGELRLARGGGNL